jgi:hypothetical protein
MIWRLLRGTIASESIASIASDLSSRLCIGQFQCDCGVAHALLEVLQSGFVMRPLKGRFYSVSRRLSVAHAVALAARARIPAARQGIRPQIDSLRATDAQGHLIRQVCAGISLELASPGKCSESQKA